MARHNDTNVGININKLNALNIRKPVLYTTFVDNINIFNERRNTFVYASINQLGIQVVK